LRRIVSAIVEGRNESSSISRRWPILGETKRASIITSAPEQKKEMGMQQAHISALQTRHAGLDARISEESQRPMPDMATISRLKKEKLKIKEEMLGLA